MAIKMALSVKGRAGYGLAHLLTSVTTSYGTIPVIHGTHTVYYSKNWGIYLGFVVG
jgi:hypothetical protein